MNSWPTFSSKNISRNVLNAQESSAAKKDPSKQNRLIPKIIIRPLSKPHLFDKIALCSRFKGRFFRPCVYILSSKTAFKSAEKSSIFSNKAGFERGLLIWLFQEE